MNFYLVENDFDNPNKAPVIPGDEKVEGRLALRYQPHGKHQL